MREFRKDGFLAFTTTDLQQVLAHEQERLVNEIRQQSESYILNVSETEFASHLVSKFSIPFLSLDFENISISSEEMMIPAELYPGNFNVRRGQSYPRQVIHYHIPFSGDSDLLKCRTSQINLSPPVIRIEGNEVVFTIIRFDQDIEAIKTASNSILRKLKDSSFQIDAELKNFNYSLESLALTTLRARKNQLLKSNEFLSSLGVPIRASKNVPSTFSVPAKRTYAIIKRPKPDVLETGYKPEPALDLQVYRQILKLVFDLGKQFERTPSTYYRKTEEQLRDHFLLFLEPNFEGGSATGETFNKKGKTDILLRHESNNVFVAELKFWTGEKGFLSALSQLISYLTWRDSKAALLLLVRNKDLSSVIDKVKSSVETHPNFLVFEGQIDDGWYAYRFHINGDKNREILVAIQLFHLANA